jgi:phenylacetate-CoA ligase
VGRRTAERLGARLVATAGVLAALPRDRRTPFLPEAKVGEIRDARLRAVVRHAAEAVPHYRDLFRELGIDPREIQSVDDLRRLPLLDKETVQRAPERFRPTPKGLRGEPMPTSGSSGTPLTIFHDRAALLRYLSIGERAREPVRRLVGTRRYRTVTIGHDSSIGERTRAYHRRATLLPQRPGRRHVYLESAPEHVAAMIDAQRPEVLAGYGHEDACHLRVVRADGVDAAPGERGEIVVSNLLNRGTVLLNYRLGDLGALATDPCGCGRSFRLLRALEGRVNEIVRLRGGGLVHPISVAAVLRLEGLVRFQLVQEAEDRFRLEVVTADDSAHARLLGERVPELRRLLGGAEVSVVRRGALESTPRRKFRRVVALQADGHP